MLLCFFLGVSVVEWLCVILGERYGFLSVNVAVIVSPFKGAASPFPYNAYYPIVNIYVKRDVDSGLTDEEKAHESEQLATNPNLAKDFHYTIDNNGTIEETYKQVIEIVNSVLMQKAEFMYQLEDMQPKLLEKLKNVMSEMEKEEGDFNA